MLDPVAEHQFVYYNINHPHHQPGVSAEHVLDPVAEHQVPSRHPALPLLPLLSGVLIIKILMMTMIMMLLIIIILIIIMMTMTMTTTMQVCLERPIYPCRSLCLGVRQGCQGRMEAYGFPWSVFGAGRSQC